MTGTTDVTTDYNELLTEAIDLREDGDYEDSIEKFQRLIEKFPNDTRVAWEYANGLMKLNRPYDADEILGHAAKSNPKDFHINKAWTLHAAFVADSMKEHMNAIRRGRAFRETFPPPDYPEAWQSLVIEIDLLWEIGLFDNLEFVLDENWNNFTTYPEILPVGIHYYAKLFLNNKVKELLSQSKPQAWAKLSAESRSNLTLRTNLALQVHDLVEATGTRVFGIGQNCMPYLVGGPWGLRGSRAHTSDLTLMDRAMFYNNTAGESIENNFVEFRKQQNFEFVKGFGRCNMPRHIQTGATFFHDRASFFDDQKQSHFFDRISRRIENWQNGRILGKRKLYIFSFCGAGDLAAIIDIAERCLLDDDSHLLIIDVLKTPTKYPNRPRVSYVHAPYPPDFIWDGISCYSKNDGFQWEMTFMSKIISILKIPLSAEAAIGFETKQRDSFMLALNESRKNGDTAGLESILAVYMKRFERDEILTLEYVSLIRTKYGNDAANNFFINNSVLDFRNKELLLLSVEVAAYSAHWNEAISRAVHFCIVVPPAADPISWIVIHLALIARYESGLWKQALDYIFLYWQIFTQKPELFATALNFLNKHSYLEAALNLITHSDTTAKQLVGESILDNVFFRLNEALLYQAQLYDSDIKIIPLGQNTMPSIILGRWGLRNERQNFSNTIPFDFCDFLQDATINAIDSDFDIFVDKAQFETNTVAVGGKIIEHKPSGATFFLARRSDWDESSLQEFHNHLANAIQNWRALADHETRIYYHIITRDIDLNRLILSAQNHLLNDRSYLIMIDTRPVPVPFSNTDQLIYVHAPMPAGYDYYHLSHSSTPEGTAYEMAILRPIFSILEHSPRGGYPSEDMNGQP